MANEILIHANSQTDPRDSMIKDRNRAVRVLGLAATPVAGAAAYLTARAVFGYFDSALLSEVGHVIGLGVSVAAAGAVALRSFVSVGVAQALVTVDQLASYTGQPEIVSYGPGVNIRLPWEKTEAKYNISLQAVTLKISGIIQTEGGQLKKEGVLILRADITRLPTYLAGVGAAGEAFASLIEATIVEYIGDKDLRTVLKDVKGVNNHLRATFVENAAGQAIIAELEHKYGVILDAVKINQLLPSDDIAVTMGASTESALIADMVVASLCKLHGIKEADYARAVRLGHITKTEIQRMNVYAMAKAKNFVPGMELKEQDFNFNVTGITPEMAQAFAAVLPHITQVMAAKNTQPGGGKSSQNPPPSGGANRRQNKGKP